MSSHRISCIFIFERSLMQYTRSLAVCQVSCFIYTAHCSIHLSSHWLLPTLLLIARSLRPLLKLSLSIHVSGTISLLLHCSIGFADAVSIHVLIVDILRLSLLPFKFSCLLILITRHLFNLLRLLFVFVALSLFCYYMFD